MPVAWTDPALLLIVTVPALPPNMAKRLWLHRSGQTTAFIGPDRETTDQVPLPPPNWLALAVPSAFQNPSV
ncbi:hypothetical protein HGG75_24925 [Ochrobactrum pseudogrignonense]|nr:hypothetical protein [Brucella pseudogrignonensis]